MSSVSNERLTFVEAGPHGECVISPENGTGPYFTLIGGGSDEEQNALAAKICDAVNTLRAQGGVSSASALQLVSLGMGLFGYMDMGSEGAKEEWAKWSAHATKVQNAATASLSSLEASPAPVSELSGQDLQLLGQLNRDNVWDGARPVLEGSRSDPDTEQAFRLSEQGYIALEQVARGVRLHITRKGVAVLSAAKEHVPEPAPVSEKMASKALLDLALKELEEEVANLRAATNQSRLAFSGMVSVQSAIDLLDKLGGSNG